MKNKILIIIILFFLSSCTNKKQNISNKELSALLNKSFSQYYETKDEKYLVEAYKSLKNNQDFNEKGLDGGNSFSIIRLLFGLKKYKELDSLLTKSTALDDYHRLNTLNIVKFLEFKNNNQKKANTYIYENIKRINDSLNKQPQDSLIFGDYFSMRMFLVGKKRALKEIDSMKMVNKKYSPIFYDEILKSAIEDYPEN